MARLSEMARLGAGAWYVLGCARPKAKTGCSHNSACVSLQMNLVKEEGVYALILHFSALAIHILVYGRWAAWK